MSDPTQATASTPTTSTNIFQQIEATLSTDWQKVAAVIQEAEQFAAQFLANVAAGAEVVIADIEAVAAYVAGNLTSINAGFNAAASLANVVAPGNATVQKAVSAVQTAAQDVADLHAALTSGSSASDPTIVTQAVTAINAVNQLADVADSLSNSLGTLAANSPTATQAVTASTTPSA